MNTRSLRIETKQRTSPEVFDHVVQRLKHGMWPCAVFQNTDGTLYVSYWHVPFGKVSELFVYKNLEAYLSWTAHGATDENNPDMLHLIAEEHYFTVVHDLTDVSLDRLQNAVNPVFLSSPKHFPSVPTPAQERKPMTPEFLLKLQALEQRLAEKLPFTAFANPARKEQLRVTFRWDGLRIMPDKVSDLPPPSLDDIEKALAALDEDSKLVMIRAGVA